jgi:hypothetical protein
MLRKKGMQAKKRRRSGDFRGRVKLPALLPVD